MKRLSIKSDAGTTATIFQVEDQSDSVTPSPTGKDLEVEATIQRYLLKHGKGTGALETPGSPLRKPSTKAGPRAASTSRAAPANKDSDAQVVEDEDVPGEAFGDDDDEEEEDYELTKRGSLKASSDAFVEVMKEVEEELRLAEQDAVSGGAAKPKKTS